MVIAKRVLVILVHGFANPSGRSTTDKFRPGFEKLGCDVEEWDYWWRAGWYSFLPSLAQVRLANRAIAYGLRRFTIAVRSRYSYIAVVSHSNGGALTYLASLDWKNEHGETFKGAPFDSVVLLNPALDRDVQFGPSVGNIFCCYTQWDWPTRLSAGLVKHWWGDAGARGLKPGDPRVVNINMASHKQYPIRDHNDVMSDKNMAAYWEPEIQRLAVGGAQ